MLETNINDKYYLSDKLAKYVLVDRNKKSNVKRFNPKIAFTITTKEGCRRESTFIKDSKGIRKLTPKECFRLMGFTDEDFIKAKQSLNNTFYKGKDKSDSQLYKQAGNSIVVSVLENIFKQLL